MIPASALPPIGAYAMARAADRHVYQIKAIRGRVPTSTGDLVSPSPTITIAHVVTGERQSMTIAEFNARYRWELTQ